LLFPPQDCLPQVACHAGYEQAARYGGEEFFGLLPNTDEECAELVGERIRSAIEKVAVLC
jgi:PleD family two-component response regulator